MKSCCITGSHSFDPVYFEALSHELDCEIQQMIQHGCIHFYFGFSSDLERLFARLLAMHQQDHPYLQLHAVFPCQHHHDRAMKKPRHARLLAKCCNIHILNENLHPGSFADKQRFLVQHSDLIIAAYSIDEIDGKYFILDLAKRYDKPILYCVPLLPAQLPCAQQETNVL